MDYSSDNVYYDIPYDTEELVTLACKEDEVSLSEFIKMDYSSDNVYYDIPYDTEEVVTFAGNKDDASLFEVIIKEETDIFYLQDFPGTNYLINENLQGISTPSESVIDLTQDSDSENESTLPLSQDVIDLTEKSESDAVASRKSDDNMLFLNYLESYEYSEYVVRTNENGNIEWTFSQNSALKYIRIENEYSTTHCFIEEN